MQKTTIVEYALSSHQYKVHGPSVSCLVLILVLLSHINKTKNLPLDIILFYSDLGFSLKIKLIPVWFLLT